MASNSQKDFRADDQRRIKIPKKNCQKNNIKKSKIKSFSTTTHGRGTCFPINPFNCSALLNDPNIKEMAEQAEEYPSLNQMAEQVGLPKSRDKKYFSTMIGIVKNRDCWTLAARLSHALMQDPSMSSMLEIYTNPSMDRGQRKRRMAHLNKDPCLKFILDEIENGGPAVMMRYWNDEKVLKMFGIVMGIPPYSRDAVATSENFGPDKIENMGNEDESIVHHTPIIESTHEEHSLIVFMLKLNLLDLLFRSSIYMNLPYYWVGYVRALRSSNSRVTSSTSTHNLPDQETQQGAKIVAFLVREHEYWDQYCGKTESLEAE